MQPHWGYLELGLRSGISTRSWSHLLLFGHPWKCPLPPFPCPRTPLLHLLPTLPTLLLVLSIISQALLVQINLWLEHVSTTCLCTGQYRLRVAQVYFMALSQHSWAGARNLRWQLFLWIVLSEIRRPPNVEVLHSYFGQQPWIYLIHLKKPSKQIGIITSCGFKI